MLKELRTRRVHFTEPNEYRILRMAREAREIARTDIASRTGLSKTTVSEITGRFVEAGILLPVGQGPSGKRGGRKRELLQFNADAALVIGVDIERTRTDVAVTNLDASILRRTSFSYPVGSSPRYVLSHLVNAVRALDIGRVENGQNAIGIGVGLPGVIDSELGIVRVADTLKGWEGFPLADHIERELQLPVFVENDVKARTLGELIFGSGRNFRDVVYLWLGDGIGAGLIIDGQLHHGFTRTAGEIGYNDVTQSLHGGSRLPLLYRGQNDIGELLSLANMGRALGRNRLHGKSPVTALVKALRTGDKRALRLSEEISEVIGSLSITVVNMLNPEVILLGGELFWNAPGIVNAVQQRIKSDVLPVPANAVQIVAASLKDDGVLLGSVGHVLFDLFRPTRETREFSPLQS